MYEGTQALYSASSVKIERLIIGTKKKWLLPLVNRGLRISTKDVEGARDMDITFDTGRIKEC